MGIKNTIFVHCFNGECLFMNLVRKNIWILLFAIGCIALGITLSIGNDLSKFQPPLVQNSKDSLRETSSLIDSIPSSNFTMPDYNENVLKQKAAAQAQGMSAEEFANYEAQRIEYERQKAEFERQKAAYEAENGPQPASMSEAVDLRLKQIQDEYKAKLKRDSIAKTNAPAK